MTILTTAPLSTSRLELEVVSVAHAGEAAVTFDSLDLHAFTGGVPSTRAELVERYTRFEGGRSPDGTQLWLNWMLRDRMSGELVGTVQATVEGWGGCAARADLAWVVGVRHQQNGYAQESARAVAEWLRVQASRRCRRMSTPSTRPRPPSPALSA
ncbi:GNAT family N-acetyltransferase [Sanguibacter antarcticus]|uniref:Acetyltransferase (GNAT) family protein n=1 Tax=Sanguibacter antarcticus TaxID=372484 RepID=A0A2A9E1D7_9MICO|nr:GNAT family N-acetyltransferase [Sanguibacter antarcticus]PFG32185.1 acetyltransferase (GNAT) family protein [Sanguibacter antarcticus]